MSDHTEDTFLTSKEAAHMLGLVPDYVSRLCRQGKIHAVREGRSWAIKESEVIRFLQEEQSRKAVHAAELSASREREYEEAELRRVKEARETVLGQSDTEPAPLPLYELWIHEESQERTPVRGHAFALSLALVAVVFTLHAYLPSSRNAFVATAEQALESIVSVLPEQKVVQKAEVFEEQTQARTTPISLSSLVTRTGNFFALTSDAILEGHTTIVHTFVSVGQKTPEHVLVFTYHTGVVTTALATGLSDALLHQSLESNVLGIIGHIALAYDTVRDSLRSVYAYQLTHDAEDVLPATVFEAMQESMLR